jgi:tRNA(Ile2) C34 agmatinyltransferase TiaS
MNNKIKVVPFPELYLRHSPIQVEFDFKCVACGKAFKARSGRAHRCPGCRKTHRDAQQKRLKRAWNKLHGKGKK